jgi:hypothetical protein
MATTLFSIIVYYNHDGERIRYQVHNFTADKLKQLREVIVNAGLMIPREVGYWIIVLPHQIVSIEVCRQKKFYRSETAIDRKGMSVNAGG